MPFVFHPGIKVAQYDSQVSHTGTEQNLISFPKEMLMGYVPSNHDLIRGTVLIFFTDII